MKKFYLVLALFLLTISSSAQQIDRHLVLLEITTGTWCYYCPAAAQGADDLHANGDPAAIIENHGPSGSDPYANAYSVARNSYYGNTSYPDAQFDGEWSSVSGGGHTGTKYSQYVAKVNQRMAIQTSYDIAIDGYHDGDVYNMTVSVTKVADDASNNLKVQLALTESDIQFNWQGMTELNFVNRLMVPNATGTSVSFSSVGQTIDVPLTFTFDNSWDIDNCELVAFIQDDGTKENHNAVTISVPEIPYGEPTAGFTGTPTSGYVPLTVSFTDQSVGVIDTWNWNFGDGESSTEQNPTHIYDVTGTYTVSLTVNGPYGTDTYTRTDYIEVIPLPPAPEADFTADVTEGPAPLNVHFTDLSSSVIDTWEWDFEGGWSGLENPTYLFSSPGTYTITLTVTGPGGTDTETKVDYITVTEPVPEPDFTADQTYGAVPLTVNFSDMTNGTTDTWLWDFGDGETSTDQNPEHIYTDEDYFDVTLTVTGPGGTNTITKDDFINTLNLLSAEVTAIPETICFGETSQLNAEASGGSGTYTYSWTSDPEGFSSDIQNPVVTPDETTIYMVEVSDGEQIVNGETTIFVNPLPEITLGDWPEELCNQQEPPVQLTATPDGGIYSGTAVTEDGIFSAEEAPLGWNVISYTYTDENGCENTVTDSIFIDNCVGIFNENATDASLNIYPNPNTGRFTLASDLLIGKVELVNQMGQIIYVNVFNTYNIVIDTDIERGVYFVRATVSDKTGNTSVVYKKILVN